MSKLGLGWRPNRVKVFILLHGWLERVGKPGNSDATHGIFICWKFSGLPNRKEQKGLCVGVGARKRKEMVGNIFLIGFYAETNNFFCLWDILINIILILANECYLFGFFLISIWTTTTVKLPMDFFFLLGEGLISERLCRLCLDASCSEVVVDREEIECWNQIIFSFLLLALLI